MMLSRFNTPNPILFVPFTNSRYYVNNEFKLFDSLENKIYEINKNFNGEDFVPIVFDNGETFLIKYSVIINGTTKSLKIPFKLWEKINVIYIDNNPNNINPTNLIWAYLGDEIYDDLMPSFRYIPGFTGYVVDVYGRVLSKYVNREISSYTDRLGYTMYGVTPDVGKRTIVGRHRLIALAWLPYGVNINKLDVNHKNGKKGDDVLWNLEWATRQQNCQHAYSTGLRNDNCEILSKNIFTNEIMEFYSISECARHFNLNSTTMDSRIKQDGQKVYYPGLMFKKKNSDSEWLDTSDPMKSLLSSGLVIPLRLTNLSNNQKEDFKSLKDAASRIGISDHRLKTNVTLGNKFFFNGYYWKCEYLLNESL